MDKTIIEFEETVIENKTVIESEKTVIENSSFSSISLQTFKDYRVVKEFDAAGSEADTFLVQKENREYFLKLYRKGVKVNEELLELIYKISKEYSYFNEILEFGYDETLQRYYEISNYLPLGSIKNLNYNSAKHFIKQLNEALHILHQHNIIHRDLKPANILVKKEHPLEIALIDFGVSSLLDEGFTKKLTTVKGTYAYFSPEGISGYIGRESDYFSFGMVLLALLDKNPFSGLDNAVIINSLVTQNIPIPPNLEKNYQTLLKGLLTRDPKKRWGYNEVSEWLAGKEPKVYFDEEEDTSKKYKFQGRYYTLQELAIAFLQEENFEIAQKHIGRGYITEFLERVEEYDLAIRLDEQESLLNKLVFFVYSIQRNLDLILYGRVIDKEYIFSLLLKKLANSLSEVEEKIFDIVSDFNFFYTITLYEELTGKKTFLKEFLQKIVFSNLANFLDIENIIISKDEELIEIALKFISIEKNINKIIKAAIKTENNKLIKRFYQKVNKYNCELLKYLIIYDYKIYPEKIDNLCLDKALKKRDENLIEVLLSYSIIPKNKKLLEKYLISKNRVKELSKFYSKEEIFEFLKEKIEFTIELFEYIDVTQAKMLLDYALNERKDKIVKFLLSKNITPVNEYLFKEYLFTKKIDDLTNYFSINEIFEFLKEFLKDNKKVLKGHKDTINSLAISDNLDIQIVTGSSDCNVGIWNINNNINFFKGSYKINSVAISNDGKYIVFGRKDGIVKLYNLQKNKDYLIDKHYNSITSVAISKDKKYFIAGTKDGIIKLWNLESSFTKKNFYNHNRKVTSVIFGSNDKFIIAGDEYGFIKIWNIKSKKNIGIFKAHTGSINDLIVTSDNKYIISAGDDGLIKMWDFDKLQLFKILNESKNSIKALALGNNEQYLYSGDSDGFIKVWDLERNIYLKVFDKEFYPINSLAVSKNDKYLIAAIGNNIKIWKDWRFDEFYILNNITKFDLGLVIKIIEEDLIDFDKLIKNLILFDELKFLKKLEFYISEERFLDFLIKNPQYVKDFEVINKKLVKKLNKTLKKQNKDSIKSDITKKNFESSKNIDEIVSSVRTVTLREVLDANNKKEEKRGFFEKVKSFFELVLFIIWLLLIFKGCIR